MKPRWAAALAIACVVIIYARTLGYGLFWDDFEVLRPWTWADLAEAWSGPYRPWQPIEFYRPLTSTYYALISNTIGFSTAALHVIPLVTIALLAVLTTVFVARESGSREMAGISGVLISVHPTLATSFGPWVANQYHTFMAIAFVAALLAWQRDRDEARAWWWRAAPWLIAAAWFKEDGLLLPLAIGAAQLARALITRDIPRPSRKAWIALAAMTVALIAWRAWWLSSQLGYGWRSPGQMLANILRAPRYVLLWQVGPPAIALPAAAAKAAVLAAAAWALTRARTSPGARLIVLGAIVMLFANVPLAFVSSEGRWHLVGWGAVLVTSGALGDLVTRAPRWGWGATAAILLALGVSASERVATFALCSLDSRAHYLELAEHADLPVELRAWLTTRDAACERGTFSHFDLPMRSLTWGADASRPAGAPR